MHERHIVVHGPCSIHQTSVIAAHFKCDLVLLARKMQRCVIKDAVSKQPGKRFLVLIDDARSGPHEDGDRRFETAISVDDAMRAAGAQDSRPFMPDGWDAHAPTEAK